MTNSDLADLTRQTLADTMRDGTPERRLWAARLAIDFLSIDLLDVDPWVCEDDPDCPPPDYEQSLDPFYAAA